MQLTTKNTISVTSNYAILTPKIKNCPGGLKRFKNRGPTMYANHILIIYVAFC